MQWIFFQKGSFSGLAETLKAHPCIPVLDELLHSVQVRLNTLNVRSSFQLTQIQSYLTEVGSSKLRYKSYDNYILLKVAFMFLETTSTLEYTRSNKSYIYYKKQNKTDLTQFVSPPVPVL